MNTLASILGAMAGKSTDPLFFVFAVIFVIAGIRKSYWLIILSPIVATLLNAGWLWSWWGEIGLTYPEKTGTTLWLLLIWILWAALLSGGAFLISSLLRRRTNG